MRRNKTLAERKRDAIKRKERIDAIDNLLHLRLYHHQGWKAYIRAEARALLGKN